MSKKIIKTVICFLVICLTTTGLLVGCDIARKIQGAEVKFQQKVKNAAQLSFDMRLNIEDADGTQEIDVSCYKNGNEYAYTFVQPDNENIVYRRLFADGKLYEFLTKTNLHVGSYYVKDGVEYTDGGNILYSVYKNVMLVTFATLITKGEKDKVAGAETYRYDISYGGNRYSLWYDSENLVKILAVLNTTNDDGSKTSETYSALFTNYRFENVATEPFRRPEETNDALYAESYISFEDWMGIIDKFGDSVGNWF